VEGGRERRIWRTNDGQRTRHKKEVKKKKKKKKKKKEK
jgi:hypothetical protein